MMFDANISLNVDNRIESQLTFQIILKGVMGRYIDVYYLIVVKMN